MHEPKQPLAEVFGFLTTDSSPRATRYRTNRLCPFNNKIPNCTKDRATHPLGMCSIYRAGDPVMNCPIRFREDWHIASDAADFFFSAGTTWTSLTDVRLKDGYAKHVATVDVVLIAYDEKGNVFDFGALGIQADNDVSKVHLRGIAGTFSAWQKRTAVAIDKRHFATLPLMPRVEKAEADMAWLIYDLQLQSEGDAPRYRLTKVDEVYTRYALPDSTTAAVPGDISSFMRTLEAALN